MHLQDHFDARGFDIAPEMLALARTKGVTVAPGDMRLFTVDEPVDAFLCLFSSIGYLDPADLPAVAERVHAALKPGGVALIEPWLTPDAVKDGHFMLQQATSPDVVAARASAVTLDGATTHVDFAWSIARPHRVETFEERHSLHVLSRADLAAPFVAAGLEASWEDRHIVMRRGLLVLRKA
ncbi:MAG: class I SAM-dependent methyltransferase [Proteobacteria bacterium]|nr:class I SAM-dependent methyltransferase [Pseudomonadota bacterium]MCP4919701.1 class I SAM-dependent methyltransferase [Pseudomonadota bacterium]